jgi:hypothetical protein
MGHDRRLKEARANGDMTPFAGSVAPASEIVHVGDPA